MKKFIVRFKVDCVVNVEDNATAEDMKRKAIRILNRYGWAESSRDCVEYIRIDEDE